MNTGELLNSIALQMGISNDAPELKSLLSNIELTKISVPDDFSNLITEQTKKMVTIDSAKQNPELKRHFIAEALNGVDAHVLKLAKEVVGMDDDTISYLKKEETTAKKLAAFTAKAKDILEKKSPASDEEKTKKLQSAIADLNRQLAEKDELTAKEKNELKNTYLNNLRDRAVQDIFNKFDYTDNLPKDVNIEVARSLFASDTKKKGYKIAFDEESNNPRLLTDADTEVHINNKPVDINQYVTSLLAENKLLKLAPIPKKNGDNSKGEPIIFQSGADAGKVNNLSYLQELESAAQDLK